MYKTVMNVSQQAGPGHYPKRLISEADDIRHLKSLVFTLCYTTTSREHARRLLKQFILPFFAIHGDLRTVMAFAFLTGNK